jgi:hypothetical protein
LLTTAAVLDVRFTPKSGRAPNDLGIALVGFVLLTVWHAPPLLVVFHQRTGRGRLAKLG